MYYYYWDSSDPDSETKPTQVFKAVYDTLKEAKAQAAHDVALGKRVIEIKDSETGKVAWTPK